MTRAVTTFISLLIIMQALACNYKVVVDANGIMRRNDTNEEVSFYGVNYTVPFAHAYRALGYIGVDRKEAIKRDVYHFARLGFNAYRIHLWDVELSDGNGNLLDNEHLDLLDFLISELEKRDIHIVITCQTNFGNGYPEKNIDTGGFSYKYKKCNIHADKNAIKAQQKYIKSLAYHLNKYTGKSFNDDNYIIGYEINNEPCHTGKPSATKQYINTMVSAIRSTGCDKPIFYNVSHNMEHVNAYYQSNIQGTTFQWYPTGLVAGHQRKGNFLPYVDKYNIPFSGVKGFNKVAKLIYEFDPADILYSYMYPAITRTFRSTGFQWITQFAYDPIDIAWANTEYQTHFLNLAYTPSKAISMMIAAEAAKQLPLGKSYGTYPENMHFENFSVDYINDLSLLNSEEKYLYSNSTTIQPKQLNSLKQIAGVGNSPIVEYEGTGAYFIDKIDNETWRLEVMPDVMLTSDPFSKPSLSKEVGKIAYNTWNIKIAIPSLGEDFKVIPLNSGNNFSSRASRYVTSIRPGTYLITKKDTDTTKYKGDLRLRNIGLNEYVSPVEKEFRYKVSNTTSTKIEKSGLLHINAKIFGSSLPDSVKIYPREVSFWKDDNTIYSMSHTKGFNYETTIPVNNDVKEFAYNIVVYKGGKSQFFPQEEDGTPLNWDTTVSAYYITEIKDSESPILLYTSCDNDIEMVAIPDAATVSSRYNDNEPFSTSSSTFTMQPYSNKKARFFLRKYVKDAITSRTSKLNNVTTLCLKLENLIGCDSIKISLITTDGYTYSSTVRKENSSDIIAVKLADMQQDATALIPAPFPVFLNRYFYPSTSISFDAHKIESVELSTTNESNDNISITMSGVWLE